MSSSSSPSDHLPSSSTASSSSSTTLAPSHLPPSHPAHLRPHKGGDDDYDDDTVISERRPGPTELLFGYLPPLFESPHMAALHGFRIVSLSWVILGISCYYLAGLLRNVLFVEFYVTRRFFFQIVSSSLLGSDSLLYLSGFLAAHSFLHKRERFETLSPLVLIIRRIARLLPALALCLVVWWLLSPLFGTGPVWEQYSTATETCNDQYWRTLLFVQNLTPSKNSEACMPWTWFIALDMQLYLFYLPLIYIHPSRPKLSYLLLGVTVLGSMIYTFVATYEYSLTTKALDSGEAYTGMYELIITNVHMLVINLSICSTLLVYLRIYLFNCYFYFGIIIFIILFISLIIFIDYFDMIVTKPWSRAKTYGIGVISCFIYAHLHKSRLNSLSAAMAKKVNAMYMKERNHLGIMGKLLGMLFNKVYYFLFTINILFLLLFNFIFH